MEELWKDMSLRYSAAAAAYRGRAAYLQEYLAAPHEPPNTALALGHANWTNAPRIMPDPFAFSFPDTNNTGDAAAAGVDLRQRRMINNRASAARSRARKHAYAKELELELEQLRRDNRMLIKRLHNVLFYLRIITL